MMVTGPSGSGKNEWTRKLLLYSPVQPPPDHNLWCFEQLQPQHKRFRTFSLIPGRLVTCKTRLETGRTLV